MGWHVVATASQIPPGARKLVDVRGRKIAVFLTKTYTRILNPALAELDPQLPPEIATRSPVARAWRAFEAALDARIAETGIKTRRLTQA